MARGALIVVVVATSACGRWAFDPIEPTGSKGDDGTGDADDGRGADANDTVAAPSCDGLPTTCGASGADSCCDAPLVPGGMFSRGFDVSGDGMHPDASNIATVMPFRLDRYETTVGRFRAFVLAGHAAANNPPLAGAGADPYTAQSGWDPAWNTNLDGNNALLATDLTSCTPATWTVTADTNDDRPINCVTFFEAKAFCAWDGGWLPTEAEWNFAAAGGDDERAYPWSSPPASLAIDGQHASYYDGTGCVGDGEPACTIADLGDVGTKPAGDGRWGHSDLAGNVGEWVIDEYGSYSLPCDDCADLPSGANVVVRGGYYDRTVDEVRTAFHDSSAPSSRYADVGLRCARTP